MHLRTLRKTIGGTLSHRQFLLCVCVPGHFCIRKFTMHLRTLRKTIGGHFRIGSFCNAFVYLDTFAYGNLLCICVPFVKQ